MPVGPYVIPFDGYLDVSRYPEFGDAFRSAPAGQPVLVDLSVVEGVDSTFLSEMLLFKRRHKPAPVVVLIDPDSRVASVFAMANLDAKVDVFRDREKALEALGPPWPAPEAEAGAIT